MRAGQPQRCRIDSRQAETEGHGGRHRLSRVIWADDGRAEDGHDSVAHELVDDSVVAEQGLRAALEHPVERLGHLLGRPALGEVGEAAGVGEEDGYLQ